MAIPERFRWREELIKTMWHGSDQTPQHSEAEIIQELRKSSVGATPWEIREALEHWGCLARQTPEFIPVGPSDIEPSPLQLPPPFLPPIVDIGQQRHTAVCDALGRSAGLLPSNQTLEPYQRSLEDPRPARHIYRETSLPVDEDGLNILEADDGDGEAPQSSLLSHPSGHDLPAERPNKPRIMKSTRRRDRNRAKSSSRKDFDDAPYPSQQSPQETAHKAECNENFDLDTCHSRNHGSDYSNQRRKESFSVSDDVQEEEGENGRAKKSGVAKRQLSLNDEERTATGSAAKRTHLV